MGIRDLMRKKQAVARYRVDRIEVRVCENARHTQPRKRGERQGDLVRLQVLSCYFPSGFELSMVRDWKYKRRQLLRNSETRQSKGTGTGIACSVPQRGDRVMSRYKELPVWTRA